MACLDANVWIYYLDADLEEHEVVSRRVDDLVRSQPLFTTTVLQTEVIHYASTQLADSSAVLDTFLTGEDVSVAELTAEDVERAADLLTTHDQVGIGGRDATVLAAMERHDVSRLWTHDQSLGRMGDRLEWLEVTDPVTE